MKNENTHCVNVAGGKCDGRIVALALIHQTIANFICSESANCVTFNDIISHSVDSRCFDEATIKSDYDFAQVLNHVSHENINHTQFLPTINANCAASTRNQYHAVWKILDSRKLFLNPFTESEFVPVAQQRTHMTIKKIHRSILVLKGL